MTASVEESCLVAEVRAMIKEESGINKPEKLDSGRLNGIGTNLNTP